MLSAAKVIICIMLILDFLNHLHGGALLSQVAED
jgi:hypothetical protein